MCQATLCLLVSLLCVEFPEQRYEKSRKMPSCSCSESKDPAVRSIIMISKLDPGLGPELVSLGDDGEGKSGERAHGASSLGEQSGRMQGEGCWVWRGRGDPGHLGCWSWLDMKASAQKTVQDFNESLSSSSTTT